MMTQTSVGLQPPGNPVSENWDDDFEFGASRGSRSSYNSLRQHDDTLKTNKPKQTGTEIETEPEHDNENWDDDFENDSSPTKPRAPHPHVSPALARRPSPENWDESFEYSPPTTPHKRRVPPRSVLREEGDGEFGEDEDDDDEDEDKTLTRRPSSAKTAVPAESPPPPVPALPSFLQPMDLHALIDRDHVMHLPPSPRQSLFSPSVLSHGSSGHDSTTHLFKTSSRGFSNLPPSPPLHKERERRRLRKKSRPAVAGESIYEMRSMSPPYALSEDEDPQSNSEFPESVDSHHHIHLPIPEHPVTPEPPPLVSVPISVPSTPAKDREASGSGSGLLSRGLGSVKRKLGRAGKKRVSTTPSETALAETLEDLDPELDTILRSTPQHATTTQSTSTPSPPQAEHKPPTSSNWFFRSPSSHQPSVSSSPPTGGNRIISSSPPTDEHAYSPTKLVKRKSFGFVPLRRGRGPINDVAPNTHQAINKDNPTTSRLVASRDDSSSSSRSPSRARGGVELFPSVASSEESGLAPASTSSAVDVAPEEERKYGPIGLGWSPHRKQSRKVTPRKRSTSRNPGGGGADASREDLALSSSYDERTPRKRSRSKSRNGSAITARKESSSRSKGPGGDDEGTTKKGGWMENVRRISFNSHHRPHIPGRHGRKDSGASLSGILGLTGLAHGPSSSNTHTPAGSPQRPGTGGKEKVGKGEQVRSSSALGQTNNQVAAVSSSFSGSRSLPPPAPPSKVSGARLTRQESSEESALTSSVTAQDADDEDEGDHNDDHPPPLSHKKMDNSLPDLPSVPAGLLAIVREGLPPSPHSQSHSPSSSPSVTPKAQRTRGINLTGAPPLPHPLPSTPLPNSASEPTGISSNINNGGGLLNPPMIQTGNSPGGSLGRNAGVGAGGVVGVVSSSVAVAGTIKARRNSLGDLKIPARISQAQIGLRRELGMVKEFKGVVDHLKELQRTYGDLTKRIEEIIDACAIPPPPPSSSSAQTRSSSRKSSEGKRSRSGSRSISKSPAPPASRSSSSLHLPPAPTNKLRKSLDHPRSAASPLPPPMPQHTALASSYTLLMNKYSLVWECAELLIELGGAGPAGGANGTTTAASSRSASGAGIGTGRDGRERAVTLSGGVDERGRSPSPSAALMFDSAANSRSDTHTPASTSSTGGGGAGGDLSARQLVLLQEILNPPSSSSSSSHHHLPLPPPSATLSPTMTSHSPLSSANLDRVFSNPLPNSCPLISSTLPHGAAPPTLDVRIDVDDDVFGPGFLSPGAAGGGGGGDFVNRDWRWGGTITREGAMGSTITLPSSTSESQGDSGHYGLDGSGKDGGGGGGGKKKRVSKLVGFRDMLRALRKGGKGSDLVASSSAPQVGGGGVPRNPDLDARGLPKEKDRSTAGRRRSKTSTGFPAPWDSVRSFSRPLSPFDTSSSSFKAAVTGGKSPRRPSLASIFKMGSSSGKTRSDNGAGTGSNSDSTSEAEEEDWDRMEDVSPLSNHANSSSTIRGKSPYLPTTNLPPMPTAAHLQHQMQQHHPYQGGGGSSWTSLHQGSRTSLHTGIRGTKLSDVRELDLVGEEGRTPTKAMHPPPRSPHRAGSPGPSSGATTSTSISRRASRPVSSVLHGVAVSASMFKSKTGSVRSMPVPVRGGGQSGDLFQLAMTPENIRPLLDNAREVSKRLRECVEEIKALLVGGRVVS